MLKEWLWALRGPTLANAFLVEFERIGYKTVHQVLNLVIISYHVYIIPISLFLLFIYLNGSFRSFPNVRNCRQIWGWIIKTDLSRVSNWRWNVKMERLPHLSTINKLLVKFTHTLRICHHLFLISVLSAHLLVDISKYMFWLN